MNPATTTCHTQGLEALVVKRRIRNALNRVRLLGGASNDDNEGF